MTVARQAFVVTLIGLLGGILGVVAAILNPQLWPDLPFLQPGVQITSPGPDGPVQRLVVVRGTADDLRDEIVWVVVQPTDTTRLHPTDGPCTTDSAGAWTCPALGLAEFDPNGTDFKILALRANATAVADLFNYQRNRPPGQFPGLPQLPAGAVIADEVVVTQTPG